MSGNTVGPYSRKLSVPFELDIESYGHYHDTDFSLPDDVDLMWGELESDLQLASSSHVSDVTVHMNKLLDAAQPDSFSDYTTCDDDGDIVVYYGLTVWHAPTDLPYGSETEAFKNTHHRADDDVDGDDERIHARRNAYADAKEL